MAVGLLAALAVSAGVFYAVNHPTECRNRVFVIGIDGITFDLVKPWVESGELPNFARIMKEGAQGPLASTLPPISPTAWTAAGTGVNPGKNNVFGFFAGWHWTGSRYANTPVNSGERKCKAVWQLASEAGLPVVVVNMPVTSPAETVNGLMISGFPIIKDQPWVYPPSRAAEFADWPLDAHTPGMRPGEEAQTFAKLTDEESRRWRTGLRLMDSERYKLFWHVLTITDRIQHHYWRFMDKNHILHDPDMAKTLGSAVLDTYKRMDAALGDVMTRMRDDDVLVVLSDHGFGPLHTTISGPGFLKANFPDGKLKVRPIDGIYACFKIRPAEYLDDGEDMQPLITQTRERLAKELRELKDPTSGKPVMQSVWVNSEIYKGPYAQEGPDVIGLEEPGYLTVNGWDYSGPGFMRRVAVTDHMYSADHRPYGVLLLYGRGIAPGSHAANAAIIDVAPTVLHLLGLPIPEQIDGRVLTECLRTDYLAAAPIRKTDREIVQKHWKDGASAEEIDKQLRGLGYVQH